MPRSIDAPSSCGFAVEAPPAQSVLISLGFRDAPLGPPQVVHPRLRASKPRPSEGLVFCHDVLHFCNCPHAWTFRREQYTWIANSSALILSEIPEL